MKIYVIKSNKNIKSFLDCFLVFFTSGTLSSILPISSGCRLFKIFPSGLINALIPLFADLNTKEGALYFSFFETPQILENLTGEIYLDFNNKFKIPYSNFSAQDNEKDLKLTFKYEEEFLLQMSSRGSEKTFLSYLPKSQRNVK